MSNVETEQKILEHKINMEERVYQDNWKACCLDLDRRCIVYFVQMSTIIGIMIFCTYQLLHKPDCHSQQAYTGLLTLLIGIMCPSPNIKENKK